MTNYESLKSSSEEAAYALIEQGRTYKEIAEITGYNLAACWARINRGR